MAKPAAGVQTFTPEASTCVARAAYHARAGIMRIWFRSGKTYIYAGVSIETWEKFATAPSKGKFVTEHIRPLYEGVEI